MAEGGYDEMQDLEPYIEKVNMEYAHIAEVNGFITFIPDEKNNSTAEEYNNLGNASLPGDASPQDDALLRGHKCLEAIQYYSRAIMNAPDGSSELATSYINRATALHKLGCFNECLADLERAEDNQNLGAGESKIRELRSIVIREEDRQDSKLIKSMPKIPEQHQNEHIKCASKDVVIQQDSDYGRHVVAARDIKPGKLIAVEKALFTFTHPGKETFNCAECMDPGLDLIPCLGCTQVMFCNDTCRKKANKKYHKYECAILKTMYSKNMTIYTYGALKMLLINKKILSNANAYAVKDSTYCSDRFGEVLRLSSNFDRRDEEGKKEFAKEAAMLYNLMEERSTLFKEYPRKKCKDIFKGLICKLSQIYATNFHALDNTYIHEKLDSTMDGIGCFPFISLLNHSCAPNVFNMNFGTDLLLLSYTDIKEGEQLFDNYGTHSYSSCQPKRQEYLKHYLFTCECVACLFDWPKEDDLENYDLNALALLDVLKSDVADSIGDVEKLRKCLNDLRELPRADWVAPSQETLVFSKIVEKVCRCLWLTKIMFRRGTTA